MDKRKRNLILGMIAASLFMVADLLWEAKAPGQDSETLGLLIDSAWADMGEWRFALSILLAAVSMPLYYLGIMEMYQIILEHASNPFDEKLAVWFRRAAVFSLIFFLFIHAGLLLLSVVFKEVVVTYGDTAAAASIVEKVLYAEGIPIVAGFILTDGIYFFVMLNLAFRKTLPVNPVLVFFSNPIITTLVSNLILLLPWPVNQLDPASESFGHFMIMLTGLCVYRNDKEIVSVQHP